MKQLKINTECLQRWHMSQNALKWVIKIRKKARRF